MSTPSAPFDLNLVKSIIHDRHVKQLQEIASTADLVLVSESAHSSSPLPTLNLATVDDVTQWTKDSMSIINKAKANRGSYTPVYSVVV